MSDNGFAWTQPSKLASGKREAFPVDALPPTLRDFALQRADDLQCDPALVAVPSFSVTSTACGAAKVKMNKKGWWEPSPIWTLTAADPGSRKSAALASSLGALNAAERVLRDADAKTRPAKSVRVKIAEKKLKRAEAAYEALIEDPEIEPTDADIDAVEESINAAAENLLTVKQEVGSVPLLNAGSFSTAERLHDLLAEHQTLGMFVAEGDTLFRKMGPSGNLDRDIFLQSWSMEDHKRNLVTRPVADAIEPFLDFGIMVQVKVILDVQRSAGVLSDVGMFDRFLPCAPYTGQLQESEIDDLSDPDIFNSDSERSPALSAYRDMVMREVLRTQHLRGAPTSWYLAPGVAEIHKSYLREWESYKHAYASSSAGALSKLAGQVARLARLFSQVELVQLPHAQSPVTFGGQVVVPMRDGFAYPITADAIKSAWTVAWWCFYEHEHLFGTALNEDVEALELTRYVLKKARQFHDEGHESFTIRYLQSRGGGNHKKDELEPCFAALVEHGWLQSRDMGRRQIAYFIHPEISRWIKEYE